ncbi:MAG: glycosyltransferase family 2 protein, partial [Bacilli bacterium]|nr:glycosyltransferase family 2 protein [Bacilli bacterium]
MKKVTVVVPVYNEEEMIKIYLNEADKIFVDNEKYSFDFLFINDGSKDQTLNILQKEAQKRDNFSYISFSRNFGQDPALEAGLKNATGDIVITMDCDLQDPPELIPQMLKKYEEGYQVVHPQRTKRKGDTFFKKFTSLSFYHFVNHLSDREIMPPNVSQFKLLTRKVVDTINKMPEKVRLLRSQVPFVGFKTCTIPFERKKRMAGKTKYNFRKMLNLALQTITTSTTAPLLWPLNIGLFLGSLSGAGFISCLTMYLIAIFHKYTFLWNNLDTVKLWLIISAIFLATSILSIVVL